MRSKQYFTSIENNPHENSTEPVKLDKRPNPLDYAVDSKVADTKKAPLLKRCFLVTATGFKPVTG